MREIARAAQFTCQCGSLPFNRPKNRYNDILPCWPPSAVPIILS